MVEDTTLRAELFGEFHSTLAGFPGNYCFLRRVFTPVIFS